MHLVLDAFRRSTDATRVMAQPAMRARVIGLGQRLAGDDAVGLAVVERLRARGVPPYVELFEAADASALLDLLRTTGPVVIVDAVVGKGSPGEVVELDAADFERASDRPLSSHGLDVVGAIALARMLSEDETSPRIQIVGVRIAAPARWTCGLSPAVGAAVERAARIALRLTCRSPADIR
jgi:hydrogenase maturation protease